MNPRHTAALALMGWYLMLAINENEIVDNHAPLDKWAEKSSCRSR